MFLFSKSVVQSLWINVWHLDGPSVNVSLKTFDISLFHRPRPTCTLGQKAFSGKYTPSEYERLCEVHLEPHYITHISRVTRKDGTIMEWPPKKSRPTNDAVPNHSKTSPFYHRTEKLCRVPGYISKRTRVSRPSFKKRHRADEKRRKKSNSSALA